MQSYREKAAQAHRLAKSILVLKGSVMGSPREEAVLKAANNWLKALEELVEARQTVDGTEVPQDAADLAEVQLVLAVTSWRSSHVPS